jgi:RNA polymerase sigma-70 factor (ECF subfamily)
MSEESGFQEFLRRIRAGEPEAAATLVRTYEPILRRSVRVWSVDPRLWRFFDPTDICQSVFASFFGRAALGAFELATPRDLLKLLVGITRKKLADHVRYESAARRDYRRVHTGVHLEKKMLAYGPLPDQEVELQELLCEFDRRLTKEERWLAEQRAQGQSWDQIAQAGGDNPEALRKKLQRALERVAGELELRASGVWPPCRPDGQPVKG